jgi:hypothetical protein
MGEMCNDKLLENAMYLAQYIFDFPDPQEMDGDGAYEPRFGNDCSDRGCAILGQYQNYGSAITRLIRYMPNQAR